MKRTILIAFIAFLGIVQAKAQKSEIFAPGGKAIKGYDPVAFFTESKPIKGADSLSYQWKEATWLFASRKNLEAFKSDPGKYAPQYGGYCAYGLSQGHKAPTQTDTWTVVNDKLYFNYNSKVKEMWSKDQQNLIKAADEKWSGIKDNN
ncbi:YHS domain-containing (seleno)protein [Mucilaginibacter lappiensis]|uniref:YHS domain-containing protein n=1 Tax=Mucilaginibacter lappiensis TaxID=354630 RepID=A0A841JJC7_9SPHI|nr:YHS domain-containing (seleno)protein [Mucilaginibacter lappiensis]MBB6131283.1 YHS domain-containing protein [Mucilaginibacter lappiensis]